MEQNISERFLISNPWLIEDPPKFLPFEFENSFKFNDARVWAVNKLTLIEGLCVIYFLFVQFGPSFMKNRKAFNLQKPLALWNFLLAVFSIMGAVRTIPTFLNTLQEPDGLYSTTCLTRGMSQPAAFWAVAFAVSKLFEFGDTVFIVLRKKPLIFLHWFHHVTMLYTCAVGIIDGEPVAIWVVVINYCVHSIMYSYYTITALKFKVPKMISMAITSLQILQFSILLSVNAYTMGVLANGGECARTPFSMRLQVSLLAIYLGLFTKLFYKSYIANPKKKVA